jgi:hypothetical protein
MKWIKILDKPPKKEQEIIVHFKNTAGWHETAAYWNGKEVITLCEECDFEEPWGSKTLITHWQPLPNPPKK